MWHLGQPPDGARPEKSPMGRAVSQNDKPLIGLSTALRATEFSIWTVFAAQNFLDVFHIMHDQRGRPLAEVRLTAVKHIEEMNRYEEFLVDKSLHEPKLYYHHHLNEMRRFIHDWVAEDKLGNCRAEKMSTLERPHLFSS